MPISRVLKNIQHYFFSSSFAALLSYPTVYNYVLIEKELVRFFYCITMMKLCMLILFKIIIFILFSLTGLFLVYQVLIQVLRDIKPCFPYSLLFHRIPNKIYEQPLNFLPDLEAKICRFLLCSGIDIFLSFLFFTCLPFF